jgi:hypothetical protein
MIVVYFGEMNCLRIYFSYVLPKKNIFRDIFLIKRELYKDIGKQHTGTKRTTDVLTKNQSSIGDDNAKEVLF